MSSVLDLARPGSPGKTHADLLQMVHQFTHTAQQWLRRSMRDDDYYHHIQWTKEESDTLKERGQPIVTSNRIMPKVNYTVGVRQRYEMTPRGYPRTPMHEDDAEAWSDIARYLVDATKFRDVEDLANQDIVRVGYGGYLLGLRETEQSVPIASGAELMPGGVIAAELEEVRTQQEVTATHVNWDDLAWDVRSRRLDFEDGIWRGILKWRDLMDVLADYGDAEHVIRSTQRGASDIANELPFADRPDHWYNGKDHRIQVAELYYRDRSDSARGWDWYVCHMTGGGFLVEPRMVSFVDEDSLTWCPLVMDSAYRNRHGERYGIVRGWISPQDEINHRKSRFLYEITGKGFWYESRALASPQEALQELQKASPALELNDGAMSDPNAGPAFGFIDKGQNSEGQMRLLSEAQAELEAVGPKPAATDRGQVSGPAITLQQEAGVMEMGPVFRRLSQLRERGIHGLWYLARQFWPEERYLRVLDEKAPKGYRFLPVNKRMTRGQRMQELMQKGLEGPKAVTAAMGAAGAMQMAQIVQQLGAQMDAQAQGMGGQQPNPQQIEQMALQMLMQSPLAQQPFTQNDIAKMKVDIVLDEVPHHAVAAQEQLMEMMRLAREGVVQFPPQMFIKESNLRNKEEYLAQLEQKPDPAAVQAQQLQMQLQMQTMQAQLQALQAQAAKWMAEAQAVGASAAKDQAQAQKYEAETRRVGSEIQENLAQAQRFRADAARPQVIP